MTIVSQCLRALFEATNPTASRPSSSATRALPLAARPRLGAGWPSTAPKARRCPTTSPNYDPEPPTDHLSFALGVALGRFGAERRGHPRPGQGRPLARAAGRHPVPRRHARRATTPRRPRPPGRGAAARRMGEHGPAIDTNRNDLRDWLRSTSSRTSTRACTRTGRSTGRSRRRRRRSSPGSTSTAGPSRRCASCWPITSTRRSTRLDGELTDLRDARDGADKKAAREAEKRLRQRAQGPRRARRRSSPQSSSAPSEGPPPTDAKCPPREQDARYVPDLDDGVMINSAALWPLLEPQWKDPKKWWKELADAKGKKDYDWSHLAMRYWPTRVDAKCQKDPSLGVAHGCFWRYHPARAWAWELRLQDEIGPDFRIEEAPYRPGGRDLGDAGSGPHRDAWLRDHAREALAAVEKEAARRMRPPQEQSRARRRDAHPRAGLWSAIPDDVWEMELRLSEKQGAEFRLRSRPTNRHARAAFEARIRIWSNPEQRSSPTSSRRRC